jgi:hypothetical protein
LILARETIFVRESRDKKFSAAVAKKRKNNTKLMMATISG